MEKSPELPAETSPKYRRLFFVFTTKNVYLYVNFVIFSRKRELYIIFWFLFYIFAVEFLSLNNGNYDTGVSSTKLL